MPNRRLSPWVVVAALALHLLGLARSSLPAQDGLKFLRFARDFQQRPWADAVRGSDQHPLYPAAIALFQPAVASVVGDGPEGWRFAAQGVSTLASIALLFPLFSLTFALFNDRSIANMAVLLWALLPLPVAVGHDTLSDPLALLATATALWMGEKTLREGRLVDALGAALAAGLGYVTRPEVALVPVAVVVWAVAQTGYQKLKVVLSVGRGTIADINPTDVWPGLSAACPGRATSLIPGHAALNPGHTVISPSRQSWRPINLLAVGFLTMVGCYAIVKGELSERPSTRLGLSIPSPHDAPRKAPHPLPDGLDPTTVNFDAKEESGHLTHVGLPEALKRVGNGWVQGMGWAWAAFAFWGMVRAKAGPGRGFLAAYLGLFTAALIRHTTKSGYVSERHTLAMVLATLPWAAAGMLLCGRRIAGWLKFDEGRRHRASLAIFGAMLVAAVSVQLWKPGHPSRWGHGAAGLWLKQHARSGETVIDTRGWARFVSGLPGYDYWHVRQALTDHSLAYVVVGADELTASSERAATLRALLAFAAEPAASFPGRKGGTGADVFVYRYHCPASWEGFRP